MTTFEADAEGRSHIDVVTKGAPDVLLGLRAGLPVTLGYLPVAVTLLAQGRFGVTGLAYAAGRTTRIKFGMSVMVLPGRNPGFAFHDP